MIRPITTVTMTGTNTAMRACMAASVVTAERDESGKVPMLSRRLLFPLAGLAAIGPVQVAAAQTPNARMDGSYGLNVSLRFDSGRWEVMVPMRDQEWCPGRAVAIEWMPIDHFL